MKLRYTVVWLILGLIGVSLVSCDERSAATPATHTTDSLDTVQQKLAAGEAVLVDVREQSEWDEGHIAGAILLPLSDLSREDGVAAQLAAKRLPTDNIVYTHCHLGIRSLTAGEILTRLGYQVRPLGLGYEELVDAGFRKAEQGEAMNDER